MNQQIAIHAAVVILAAWCAAEDASSQTAAEHGNAKVNVAGSGADARAIVGTYYYAWYEGQGRRSSWRNVFRQRLAPSQLPKAGLYRSSDPDVIKEHIS